MERHIMWVPWEEPGLEHLHLIYNNENIIADSMIRESRYFSHFLRSKNATRGPDGEREAAPIGQAR